MSIRKKIQTCNEQIQDEGDVMTPIAAPPRYPSIRAVQNTSQSSPYSSLPLSDRAKYNFTSPKHPLIFPRRPLKSSQVKSAQEPKPSNSNIEIQHSTPSRAPASPGSSSRDILQRLQRYDEVLLMLIDNPPLVIDKSVLTAHEGQGNVQFPLHLEAVAVTIAVLAVLAVLAPHNPSHSGDRVPQGRNLEPDGAERVLHPVRRGRGHGRGAGQHAQRVGVHERTQGVNVAASSEGAVHAARHDSVGRRCRC